MAATRVSSPVPSAVSLSSESLVGPKADARGFQQMFWALQATHRALCQTVAKIEDGGKTTMRAWQAFVKKTIEWARNSKLVPAKSIPEFLREKARMLECAELCDMACLYAAWAGRWFII